MKNLNRILKSTLSTMFVVGALAGCASQWNQDPLADKDGVLKTGQLKPTQPEAPKAIDSNNVVVENEEYIFREGIAGQFTISARILENGYVPTMSVENLSDFPGASISSVNYDQTTRVLTTKFAWTPAFGVVTGINGQLQEEKLIKLLIVGNRPNSKVITGRRTIRTSIGKVVNTPDIFSVSRNTIAMREGESTMLTLKIRDKDAGIDAKSYPNILILPVVGYADPSQFITINQIVGTGNNEFTVILAIDLTTAELTKSRGIFSFNLKAVSRFNQVSSGQSVLLNVLTSFSDLQSSWFDVLEVPVGAKKDFQFMIFDPKSELSVSTPYFSGLPSGATVKCNSVGVNQLCTFSWTPDFSVSTGDYSIQAQVGARNQDPQDTFVKNTSINLKLRVISAPPVSISSLQGGK